MRDRSKNILKHWRANNYCSIDDLIDVLSDKNINMTYDDVKSIMDRLYIKKTKKKVDNIKDIVKSEIILDFKPCIVRFT